MSRLYFNILVVFATYLFNVFVFGSPIHFHEGAYGGITISIDRDVPATQCISTLENLEVAMEEFSRSLYKALRKSAFVSHVSVILPEEWPDSCTEKSISVTDGETVDIKIGKPSPVFGHRPWTEQYEGCEKKGHMIHLSYQRLQNTTDLGTLLMAEFVKFYYGVFLEMGFDNDSVYPLCYFGRNFQMTPTGCSDREVQPCTDKSSYVMDSTVVHPNATSSVMYTLTVEHVNEICDEGTHNHFAPTKHNFLCHTRSMSEVIFAHPDFNYSQMRIPEPVTFAPEIVYKRRSINRYVFILIGGIREYIRDSWAFLRLAVKKLIALEMSAKTEVAFIGLNESGAFVLQELSPLLDRNGIYNYRDKISSKFPSAPLDSETSDVCVDCAYDRALKMLNKPGNNNIIIVAPGMVSSKNFHTALRTVKDTNVRVININYPNNLPVQPLDILSSKSNGKSYMLTEEKDIKQSSLSTYFNIANVFRSIQNEFDVGNFEERFIEIHRKEFFDHNVHILEGEFELEPEVGEPAHFFVYNFQEGSDINSMKLISPSGAVYSDRSDRFTSFKLITLYSHLNETGTWTYTVDTRKGSSQPYYVQVLATPKSSTNPPVIVRGWISKPTFPLAVYAKVVKGDNPVVGAKVEVVVRTPSVNGTNVVIDKFELYDNGAGEPDITRGDGVYSKYYDLKDLNLTYYFDIKVDGHKAYMWASFDDISQDLSAGVPCCGSVISGPSLISVHPFERYANPIAVRYSSNDVWLDNPVGRIGDLRVQVSKDPQRPYEATLTWTSPDIGGLQVQKYEVRYSHNEADILYQFDKQYIWKYGTPRPLPTGFESTLILDFSKNASLRDSHIFLRIRGTPNREGNYKDLISNIVHVYIPNLPPPTVPSTASTTTRRIPVVLRSNEKASENNVDREGIHSLTIENPIFYTYLIVTVVALIFIIVFIIFIFVCVKRRRQHANVRNGHEGGNSNIGTLTNGDQTTVCDEKLKSNEIGIPPIPPPASTSRNLPRQNYQGVPIQFDYEHMNEGKHKNEFNGFREDEQMQKQYYIQDYVPGKQSYIPQQLEKNGTGLTNKIPYNNFNSHQNSFATAQDDPNLFWSMKIATAGHEIQYSPNGGVNEIKSSIMHPPPVPPLPSYDSQISPPSKSSTGYAYPVVTNVNRYNGSSLPLDSSLKGSQSSVSIERPRRIATIV